MRRLTAIVTILLSAILLFTHLGHYALWDDEAITALTARGVWRTGDTSAIAGHNYVLYRNGLITRDLKDRATPPLQFYVVAPFLGLLGDTPLAARLPFAVLGIACVSLVLYWLKKSDADATTWLLTAIAIIGNVSFMLYFRQCRYYGLTMFFTVAAGYAYLHVNSHRNKIILSIVMLLLLAANYMTFAAVVTAMLFDYLIWQRRRSRIAFRDLLLIALPSIWIGGAIVWIWNPLRIAEPPPAIHHSWITERLILLWWNLRDLDACEMGPGILLLASPLLFFIRRDAWLLRSFVALSVCIVVISIVSPQHVGPTSIADVRYLSALIPLCIAVSVLALRQFPRGFALFIGAIAFFTNALNASFFATSSLHSTPYLYALELLHPPSEPITPVVQWIDANVKRDESIVVVPPHMIYPLMFHAPQAIYAWQLSAPVRPDLAALPRIHMAQQSSPDYVILFSEHRAGIGQVTLPTPEPTMYQRIAQLNVWGHDAFRPELFLRTFLPVKFDPQTQGVLIFRKVEPASMPAAP
jgi:hypothetical protein